MKHVIARELRFSIGSESDVETTRYTYFRALENASSLWVSSKKKTRLS
jgi:hypothetical protein